MINPCTSGRDKSRRIFDIDRHQVSNQRKTGPPQALDRLHGTAEQRTAMADAASRVARTFGRLRTKVCDVSGFRLPARARMESHDLLGADKDATWTMLTRVNLRTSATKGGQALYDIHTDRKRPSALESRQRRRPCSTENTAMCNFGSDGTECQVLILDGQMFRLMFVAGNCTIQNLAWRCRRGMTK